MRFTIIVLSLLIAGSVVMAADQAPQVKLKDLDGKSVALSQYWENGPVLVDFWATFCTPCKEALPHVDSLRIKYGKAGLTVIAASVDGPKSMGKVQPFVEGEGYGFMVLLDPSSEALKAFGGKNIPHTVLIDKGGKIVHTKFGYLPGDEELMEAEILKLLPTPTK